MADNTQLNTGTGGDIISTDVITTLNGGAIVTGEKAQRVKVGWGADAVFNDTNATNPLPVTLANTSANATAVKVDNSAVTQPISAASLPLPSTAATSTKQSDGSQKTQIVDGSGNVISSTTNALDVNVKANGAASIISTSNSSVATLLASAVFTGTGEDVTLYNEMRVSVFSNAASATDGLSIQQSIDNTNWDITDTYTIPAATGKTFVVPRQARYFRIVYTNGGTNQASFRLQAILNRSGGSTSSQRPSDGYTNETDLTQSQSFEMAYNGTSWDRVSSGNRFGDGGVGTGSVLGAQLLYNGSTYDRQRSSSGVTGATAVGGLTASGSSLAAAPVTKGGLAKTANPTAVADGQVVNSLHDKLGKQVVVGSLRDLKGDQRTILTSTTTETTIVTAVASTFLDLYGLEIENTSATAVSVSFRDVTAGTVRFSYTVPPNDIRGFMLPESAAKKQATVNTAWTAQCGTSVASVNITAYYVKNI